MVFVSNLRFVIFSFTFILISFSCSEQDKRSIEKSASAFDIKQAGASIQQSNQNFMKLFKAGDSVNVAKIFSTDAKTMGAHSPTISGRANITHYISQTMKLGIKNLQLNTTTIWGDSSIVAEEGTYSVLDSAGKKVDKGKYIVLWKQETGNWKMFRDIWTTDLADTTRFIKSPVIE